MSRLLHVLYGFCAAHWHSVGDQVSNKSIREWICYSSPGTLERVVGFKTAKGFILFFNDSREVNMEARIIGIALNTSLPRSWEGYMLPILKIGTTRIVHQSRCAVLHLSYFMLTTLLVTQQSHALSSLR